MAVRSTHKGVYASDILVTNFTRRVDDHLFTQANLGWTSPIGGELPLPRSMKPRHAQGIDTTGRQHSVVVPDNTSPLWTRAASTWDILDDTGVLDTVTVTGLIGEALTL
jgi:hypothetical protein